MLLYLKRWSKLIRCTSLYFLIRLLTRHSVSAGGFLVPPPKKTSYSILRRRTLSSSSESSSSTVTRILQGNEKPVKQREYTTALRTRREPKVRCTKAHCQVERSRHPRSQNDCRRSRRSVGLLGPYRSRPGGRRLSNFSYARKPRTCGLICVTLSPTLQRLRLTIAVVI